MNLCTFEPAVMIYKGSLVNILVTYLDLQGVGIKSPKIEA